MPHSSLFYAVLVGATAGRSSSSPPDPRLTPPEPCSATGGTLSYNGICTPKEFPPRQNYSRAIPHPPYLKDPPLLINITTGRQLFVDDFLIANASGVATAFHTAHYYDQNPVIKPDQPWEGTFAMPFSGGAWWEDDKQRLALWYRCGGGYAESGGSAAASDTTLAGRSGPSTTGTCLAFSDDGIHFNKTLQDVRPGTNMVREVAFDGNTVWLDKNERNASRRYKMADVDADQGYSAYTLLSSPDGIHWHTEINRTGTISDCSRIFYNPFRDRWVFSIKANIGFGIGRSRGYWESPELFDPTYTRWKQNSPTGDSKTPGPGCKSRDSPPLLLHVTHSRQWLLPELVQCLSAVRRVPHHIALKMLQMAGGTTPLRSTPGCGQMLQTTPILRRSTPAAARIMSTRSCTLSTLLPTSR